MLHIAPHAHVHGSTLAFAAFLIVVAAIVTRLEQRKAAQ